MREELFQDRNMDKYSAEIIIETAINFGGFDFIREVQEKSVLVNSYFTQTETQLPNQVGCYSVGAVINGKGARTGNPRVEFS